MRAPRSSATSATRSSTGEDGADRTAAAYGSNYGRLRAVKAAYDPQNLFRVNRNIVATA